MQEVSSKKMQKMQTPLRDRVIPKDSLHKLRLFVVLTGGIKKLLMTKDTKDKETGKQWLFLGGLRISDPAGIQNQIHDSRSPKN